MSDDNLRTRIAAVQRKHREELFEENVCICGFHGNYPKHVADAVIRELGLHPVETLDRRYVRHCTKWRDNPDWKGGE